MRIDREFLELLAGCPRVFLFSLTGQIMIIMLCDRMLVRRRSLWRFLACLSMKSIVTTIFVSTILQYYYPDELWVDILGALSSACAVLLCYIPFLQTYYGGAVKCLAAEFICETIVSMILSSSFIFTGYLEKRENVFTIYGTLQIGDFAWFILVIFVTAVFCRAASPLLQRFRTYRIKNKKLAAAGIILYFASLQIMGIGDVRDGHTMMLLFYVFFLGYAVIVSVVLALMYLYHRQHARTENSFLKMQVHLMESHYASIQTQILKMESCQRLIDAQMKEIENSKELSKGKTSAYLEQLKQNYNEIRAGMYCDDWKVDAVLYCQSDVARKQGIDVTYHLEEYNRGGITQEELVHILVQLFEFGIKANQKVKEGIEKKISLKMGGVLNRFVIEFITTVESGDRLSHRKLQKCIKEYRGDLVTEKRKNETKFLIALKRTDG